MLLIPVPQLPSQQVHQQLQSKETLLLSPQLQAWHQHYVSVGHTNMGICEKPNLVLKIFASFSTLTKYDTLLPFVPQLFMHKMHKDFSPRFHRSRAESLFQEIGIPALHMHPCNKRKKMDPFIIWMKQPCTENFLSKRSVLSDTVAVLPCFRKWNVHIYYKWTPHKRPFHCSRPTFWFLVRIGSVINICTQRPTALEKC